ncbi:hypothetical protein AB0I37_16205 [Micromonospora purpureochromogenes]|uniref:hypothetical protein n=1 Tax=Micromonospora purpureochromogenes TaxID=47872 RepID=UPI0033F9972E
MTWAPSRSFVAHGEFVEASGHGPISFESVDAALHGGLLTLVTIALLQPLPLPAGIHPRQPGPTPQRIEQTITAMADAQQLNQPPALVTAAQAVITECGAKLKRCRAALDAGADPAVATGRIAHTQADRARAEADLHANASTTRAG